MSEQETEPEVDETEETDEEFDNPGIRGQILYPDPEVDAEHAAGFAGGKYDTLYPEDDPRNESWTNPADRSSEVETGDESGEETEPTENPDYDPNDPAHH